MKTHPFALLVLGLLGTGGAVAQPPPSYEDAASPADTTAHALFTVEQLDHLLGPIALYPDALVALILPASTFPADVVLAARYLQGGDPARVEEQPWDDSVRALAHYPDVVKWMDENLRWTQQLGQAFRDQPAEVMKSVQHLRATAREAGTLVDTPQQHVVTEGEAIAIVPAQPDVIYVPYYDPGVVYVRHSYYPYYPTSFFSFSIGYPTGCWLGYSVDWSHRRLWVVNPHVRPRYWHDQTDWRRPVFPAQAGIVGNDPFRHMWTPSANVRQVHSVRNVSRVAVVGPAPISQGMQQSSVQTRRENFSQPQNPNILPLQPIPFARISTQPASTPAPIPFASISTPAAAVPSSAQPTVISRGARAVLHDETKRSHEYRLSSAAVPVAPSAVAVPPANPGRTYRPPQSTVTVSPPQATPVSPAVQQQPQQQSQPTSSGDSGHQSDGRGGRQHGGGRER